MEMVRVSSKFGVSSLVGRGCTVGGKRRRTEATTALATICRVKLTENGAQRKAEPHATLGKRQIPHARLLKTVMTCAASLLKQATEEDTTKRAGHLLEMLQEKLPGILF